VNKAFRVADSAGVAGAIFAALCCAIVGAVALVSGLVYVHGILAKVLIGVEAVLLVAATAWNVRPRSVCAA
jgi:hypothetical protein